MQQVRIFPFGVGLLAMAVAVAVAALFIAPINGYAQRQEPNTDAVAVARAWVSALDAHDFDRAVVLLDDNAYLVLDSSPSGTDITTYEGKAHIRQALEQYAQDNTRVQIIEGPQEINGTTAWTERQSSIRWKALGLDYVDMSADAIIEAGQIKSIIYELTPDSAERVANAPRNGGTATPTSIPTGDIPTTAVAGTATATPVASTATTAAQVPIASGSTAPTAPKASTASATPGETLGMPRTGARDQAAPYDTWITVLVLVGSGFFILAAGITLRRNNQPL